MKSFKHVKYRRDHTSCDDARRDNVLFMRKTIVKSHQGTAVGRDQQHFAEHFVLRTAAKAYFGEKVRDERVVE